MSKMKTAEEWIQYLDPNTSSKSCCYSPVPAASIKQIQLDAVREGMRRAAEIQIQTGEINCGLAPEFKWKGLQEVRMAILTAVEQLTIKDL